MEVYIVLISSKRLHSNTSVGAVYRTREEAQAEVDRLRKANSYTEAWWTERLLREDA